MKLFTHNMLTSQMLKSVQVGYPLKIAASEIQVSTAEFQPTFVMKMLPKVNWNVLLEAVQRSSDLDDLECRMAMKEQKIGHGESAALPLTITDDISKTEEFLKKAHHALFEIEVITGEMECPESGRKFPIQNGVANMLINEDEV